jgi:hypothetical protein
MLVVALVQVVALTVQQAQAVAGELEQREQQTQAAVVVLAAVAVVQV